jgi:hypothetical protein
MSIVFHTARRFGQEHLTFAAYEQMSSLVQVFVTIPAIVIRDRCASGVVQSAIEMAWIVTIDCPGRTAVSTLAG